MSKALVSFMDLLPGWLGSYSDSLKSFSSSPLLNESVHSGSDIGALQAWMLLQGQYEPFWQGFCEAKRGRPGIGRCHALLGRLVMSLAVRS